MYLIFIILGATLLRNLYCLYKRHLKEYMVGCKVCRKYLQLTLRQWGDVYLLVLSSWKVNIVTQPPKWIFRCVFLSGFLYVSLQKMIIFGYSLHRNYSNDLNYMYVHTVEILRRKRMGGALFLCGSEIFIFQRTCLKGKYFFA